MPFKKMSNLGNRGAKTENAVLTALDKWVSESPLTREANRLIDSKAAGRLIKKAAADFDFYSSRFFGLIEAKETEHEYRLARDKVTQLPTMRKRANAGGICIILVHHSTTDKWRAVPLGWLLENGDKGSWNLTDLPVATGPRMALQGLCPWVFA